MSVFKNRVDNFCNEFHLSTSSKIQLYGHYPLFKAVWHQRYGKGVVSNLSRGLLKVVGGYRLNLPLQTKSKEKLILSVSFDPHDLDSFQEIFFGSEYQSPWDLSSCKTLVDVGANIGLATQYFLTKAPLEKIVMVEANPQLVEHLKRLMRRQKLNCQVLVEDKCISGESGVDVQFSIDSNNRDSAISDQPSGNSTLKYKTTSLSDLLKQKSIDVVDILKMDIEGAEHNVIKNDSGALKKCRFVFFEVHGSQAERENFKECLQKIGFEVKESSSSEDYQCSILSGKNTLV